MQRTEWYSKSQKRNELSLSWRYPGTMYEGNLRLTRKNGATTLKFAAPCNHEVDTLFKYRVEEHMDWREYILDNSTDVEDMKFFLDEINKRHPFEEHHDEVYKFAGIRPNRELKAKSAAMFTNNNSAKEPQDKKRQNKSRH